MKMSHLNICLLFKVYKMVERQVKLLATLDINLRRYWQVAQLHHLPLVVLHRVLEQVLLVMLEDGYLIKQMMLLLG